MQVVETFGSYVDKLSQKKPEQAKRLLRTGWTFQDQRLKFLPDKRLTKADQYLAKLMMDTMLYPLKHPDESVIVSIFTPCELMEEVGLHPYNVESFSGFLSGSRAEGEFLQQAENLGLSESLCSYHKTFIGAAERGILPPPKCIVYTNLACDANLLTFSRLARMYDVPSFSIDVPTKPSEDNVAYVAGQLKDLGAFLEKCTGRRISEDSLKERVARSKRSLKKYDQTQIARRDRFIPVDLVTPFYGGVVNNILLGTKEQERYLNMLMNDIKKAPPARGKRIYWMHTIPFWSEAAQEALSFRDDVQIVGCEVAAAYDTDFDPEDPYMAMAHRMVYHVLNGSINRRIENGIRRAKEVNADGVIWFAHWGCKHTLGAAQLAKKKFEEQGLPLLILDGDGCDRSHGGEGQTATRLGAFLEMLEGGRNE